MNADPSKRSDPSWRWGQDSRKNLEITLRINSHPSTPWNLEAAHDGFQ